MIQDTVRTWYVIYMYPIHGQDTRNTGLYKRSKTNHHKKTFTKIFSLEIFFFFFFQNTFQTMLMPSSNNFQQQLRPTDDDLHHPRAQKQRSCVPPAGCTLSMTFIFNFTASNIELSRFYDKYPQVPHATQAYTQIWFHFIYKTIPKIESCHFHSSSSHVCLLAVKDISRV